MPKLAVAPSLFIGSFYCRQVFVLAPQGRRYGLIGRNGAGKSTLLREIAYYKFDKFPKNLKAGPPVVEQVANSSRAPFAWVLYICGGVGCGDHICSEEKELGRQVLMVEQEVVGDDRKPVEWVLHSDVERRRVEGDGFAHIRALNMSRFVPTNLPRLLATGCLL